MGALDSFVNFVNNELPKRVGTEDSPISWVANRILVATGIGLGATTKTLVDLGIASQASLDALDTTLRAYTDSVVVGLWKDQGSFNASGGAYPTSANTIGSVAIKKGFIWTISVQGTSPSGKVLNVGDNVRALVDGATNAPADWAEGEGNNGYVPENTNNKSDDTTLAAGSSTLFPTQNAVKTYVLAGLAALTEFATSTFRIKDSADSTKKVSWILTALGTGTTKTITMPNANVNLGRIPVSQAFNSATGIITTTATDGTANPTVSIATGIVITVVSPTSPVAMSGLSSRAYILNGNTTFDLTGWASDGSELLIKNGNVNTTYSVTITGVTADTFLSEGGLGGSHGVLGTGTVGVTLTLRCGEVFRVRPIGANLYRIFRSFAPWEQISDVKMYSTNTSALYSVSYAHASGAGFTTNCVITIPNVTAVNLGKIPTALSYSGSTLTQTTTDGLTLTATITKPVPTKQTTSFAFASSNIVCRWDAGVSGAKTISLPATPADGDTVELWDNEESSVYGGSGITTLTVIASAGTYIIANPLTSYDVLSGQGGVSGMGIRFVYRISSLTWSVQYFYADRFNSLDWYLEDGTNSARSMKFSLAALTAQRTIIVPDANVNLGKIPSSASYAATTGVLTLTNTDATTTTVTVTGRRYSFNVQSGTTYTIAAADVTPDGIVIIELSNGSFTDCTVPTPTSLGVTAGDSVNVSITGAYAAQKLLAGSGATLVGNALFSTQYETKTLVAKDSTTWKVVGG